MGYCTFWNFRVRQKKLQSTVFNDHPVLAAIGSATILFLKFSMPVDIYFELCGAKLIGGGNLGIGEGQQSLPPNENLANESQPLNQNLGYLKNTVGEGAPM